MSFAVSIVVSPYWNSHEQTRISRIELKNIQEKWRIWGNGDIIVALI
jgi:hypothetical protein